MTIFIILFLIILIVVLSKKKNPSKKVYFKNSNSLIQPSAVNSISAKSRSKAIEDMSFHNTNSSKINDDSVIDVSELVSTLIGNIKVTSDYTSSYFSIPYWAHQYIYSYNEINYATQAQREFYEKFRNEFLKENFIYLNGNNNYAFILLFDLLNEFENHKDYHKIEKQLEDLGNNYARTKSYCVSFLLKKLEEYNMDNEADLFREKNYQYDYDYWKLGRRYKKKLNLTNEQEQILNRIWLQNNVFNEIEFCKIEIIKGFLRANEFLQRNYVSTDNSFENLMDELSDFIVRKYYHYRKGSQNYKYTFDSVKGEIYGHILKLTENNVREEFSNKRKLTAELNYRTPEILNLYDQKIISKLADFFVEDKKNIIPPDLDTEKLLNESNTTRWKSKFEKILKDFSSADGFENQIINLAEQNVKNPSVENIFYEASKSVAKIDKVCSLRLYLRYIDADLKSTQFDNRQMNKTIQKSLFKTAEQFDDFEKILNKFIVEKNLEEALKSINEFYIPKRRKISIDKKTIQDVQKQHSGTVSLLNEYLQEEMEEDVQNEEWGKEEDVVQINIINDNEDLVSSKFLNELNLSELQKEVLEIIEKNSFSISQTELEDLLKSRSQMMSSVVDSINENCFETFDDVLIEEEDEYFTINENYYKKLLKND